MCVCCTEDMIQTEFCWWKCGRDDQHFFVLTTSESATESSHADTIDLATAGMSTHPCVECARTRTHTAAASLLTFIAFCLFRMTFLLFEVVSGMGREKVHTPNSLIVLCLRNKDSCSREGQTDHRLPADLQLVSVKQLFLFLWLWAHVHNEIVSIMK